jgi:hypothetical protein
VGINISANSGLTPFKTGDTRIKGGQAISSLKKAMGDEAGTAVALLDGLPDTFKQPDSVSFPTYLGQYIDFKA